MHSPSELYISTGGRIIGPFSAVELAKRIEDGLASPDLEVCVAGTSDWVRFAEHAPAIAAEAATKVLCRAERTKRVAVAGVVLVSIAALAIGVWGWVGVSKARLAEKARNSTDELSQLAESKLQAVSIKAAELSEESTKLQADVTTLRRENEEARRKVEAAEKDRTKLADELKGKASELQTKAERLSKAEGLAVRFADELAASRSGMLRLGLIPQKVRIVLTPQGYSWLDFDERGIYAEIAKQFRAANFSVVDEMGRIDEVIQVRVGLYQKEIRFFSDSPTRVEDAAIWILDFDCHVASARGNLLVTHAIYSHVSVNHATRRYDYNSNIREAATKNSIAAITELRRSNRLASEHMENNPPVKWHDELIAAGIIKERPRLPGKEPPPPVATGASGSGVLISSRPLVVTNHHVVRSGGRIHVHMEGGAKREAEVLHTDREQDLAILKLKDPLPDIAGQTFPVLAGDGAMKTGADVYALGFPLVNMLGKEVKYTSGTVSALTGLEGATHQFQLSAPIQPGNSGGPVFFKDGTLCGVVCSTLNPFYVAKKSDAIPQNVNYAIHATVLVDFLKRHDLWAEAEKDKRGPLDVEQAKKLTVRLEVDDGPRSGRDP